ncbi:adenosine deaminase 2 [Aplysia californica]|uniref:adenosine deaminase n=1 Tax=Aplysia californica TaxID=6500 RepID=A0ABM1A541_APLCA|nr:adenosine deaminase 2 [Aplysia californica]
MFKGYVISAAVGTTFVVLVLWLVCSSVAGMPSQYAQERKKMADKERSMRLGSQLTLNDREEMVNCYLMSLKQFMIATSTAGKTLFPPSQHFFHTKADIDNSTLFHIIQMMPKGGSLHLHESCMTSLEWVIKNLTYMDNLYTRMEESGEVRARLYLFSQASPGTEWTLMSELRAAQTDVDRFDQELLDTLAMWGTEPYASNHEAWNDFHAYFRGIDGFLTNMESRRLYDLHGIEEAYDDGLQYLEWRVSANNTDMVEYIRMLQGIVKDFKAEHPDFLGVKVIFEGMRESTPATVSDNVRKVANAMKLFPDEVKGYDLTNEEDVVNRLEHFVDVLVDDEGTALLPYFFHAGETTWSGGADMNLLDAVLLNTTRIGHGFATVKHPEVLKAVMERPIPVEVNPVSNQVLALVRDLRDHPASSMISYGAPVVISSDNPNVYFAKMQSHDSYAAFMGLASQQDDLRLLKQLAINSLKYSAMTETEKTDAFAAWQIRWDLFVEEVIAKYNLESYCQKPNL